MEYWLPLLHCKVLLATVKFCLSFCFPCCRWKIAADDPLIHVFARPSPTCIIPTWLLQEVNVPIIAVLWLGLFTNVVMVSFAIVAATLFPGDALHAVFIKEGLWWRTLRVAACSNINRFVSRENWLTAVRLWLIHKCKNWPILAKFSSYSESHLHSNVLSRARNCWTWHRIFLIQHTQTGK